MTMNSSGPISLAGTTAGQSIEIELSGSGTTQISLNDANVRSLAGVASGAITMPTNFYGKSSASYYIAMIQVGTHAGSPSGIVFDGSNNAIIGFGSTTNPNYSQLISLNQTGAINWAIEISNSTNFQINSFWAYCQSLAFDGTYIYATGSYGTAYQSLFKFNTSGTMLANGYISNNAWTSLAIDADSSHNVYIAGQYSYSSGSCALPGSGFSKISLSPATPVETYSYVVTDNGGDYSGVTYDSSGNLHAVGATSSAVYRIYNTSGTVTNSYTLGGGTADTIKIDSSGNRYIALRPTSGVVGLVKLNSSNVIQWSVKSTRPNTSSVYTSLVIDSSGNSYYTQEEYNGSTYVTYIFKVNSSGSYVWQRSIVITAGALETASNVGTVGNCINISSDGSVLGVLLKYFTTGGISRALVMKLPVDGSKTGSYTITDSVNTSNNLSFTYAASSVTTNTLSLSINTTPSGSTQSASGGWTGGSSSSSTAPNQFDYNQSI